GTNMRIRIVGYAANSSVYRIIQLDFGIAQRASAIFNYGVASKGTISMNGHTEIQGASDPTMGSVLSATTTTNTPVTMTGSTSISGDVSMVNSNGAVGYTGNPSISGSSDPTVWINHVHAGVTPPQFPN